MRDSSTKVQGCTSGVGTFRQILFDRGIRVATAGSFAYHEGLINDLNLTLLDLLPPPPSECQQVENKTPSRRQQVD
jgi:hypothetical protein